MGAIFESAEFTVIQSVPGATLARHRSYAAMQITVYIPHLIPPREIAAVAWHEANAPRLKAALARAACSTDTLDSQAQLCQLFGITRQQDWPLAPLLAAEDSLATEKGYWLCATPMHLETRRYALVAADGSGLNISEAESAAFVTTLSEHLRSEGITLHAPCSDRWYLQCDSAPAMATTPLHAVVGQDVRTYLPTGKDSARWHRTLTEMQMLLHDHPANAGREARGLPPVNSVWLWGGGVLHQCSGAPFATVTSSDTAIRALARHAGCRLECPSPPFALAMLNTPEAAKAAQDGTHFFSYESLIQPMREGNLPAWCAAVTLLEKDWIAPMLDALVSGRVSALTLLSSQHQRSRQFAIRAADRWKWWRKNSIID